MPTKRGQVTAALRAAVLRGDYVAGQRLPAEHQLAETFSAGRSTVHQALRQLITEGLIRGAQGSGYVIRDRSPITRDARKRLTRKERQAGRGAHLTDASDQPVTISTDLYFERASDQTAALLEIAPGEEVVVRQRVLGVNDEPTQLATSRLPRSITRDTQIEDEDTGKGGLLARLDELGFKLARATEDVAVHYVTAAEAELLRLPEGAASLAIHRLQPDAEGRPLEINSMIACDRYVLRYPVPVS